MKRLLWLLLVAAALSCGGHDPSASAPTEGFIEGSDGNRLFYRVLGDGADTLVVIHGFQGNNQNYLAADLAGLLGGRSLLFYDQRGGGRSDPGPGGTPAGLGEHVADLEALRSAFSLERLDLLAHSGGAYIAAQYALDHPDRVGRMVLVAPGPPDPTYSQEVAAGFSARLDSVTWARLGALHASIPTSPDPAAVCREISSILLPRAYLADPSALARMTGSMCDAPGEALKTESERRAAFQASVSGRDWTTDLGRIGAPVVVIHGDRDAIPVAAARSWAESLPDGRLVVLRGADHFPWLDRPAGFSSAVAGFRGEP